MGFTQSSSIILLATGLPCEFVYACVFVCTCVTVFVLYTFFLHTVSTCAKHFNFQEATFSLACPLPRRVAVKSCTEHHIQQLMFSAGYSISHQGSGLGVYFMAFPVQSSKIGNEKAAKDSLVIRNAKGYY